MTSPILLPQQRLEEDAAQKLAAVAATVAATLVTVYLLQYLMQPQIAPILGDPVVRLAALVAVLMAIGLLALRRYNVVTPRTLLRVGMPFEIVVAFSIAMVETSRPIDVTAPLLGLSAVGPWIALAAAAIPNPPSVRLGLALAAATTWPLAYWINSMRLGFVTESWRQTSIWPAMNYLFVVFAYRLGRWRYSMARARAYATDRPASDTGGDGQTARSLGSYELMWPIGDGAMGEVWRAKHRMLVRPAAIKLVKLDTAQQEVFARRFHREANAIAGLQSPHTVYLYDFGTAPEGRLYYVMELLDGISLQTLVTTFGPQPASRVVSILRQICRSLEEAHVKKIVHRDLKPSNVMICQVAQVCDFVKVLDFGLAKPFGGAEDSQLTVSGFMVGTPEYMAPEMVVGSSSVDARADLYALGCIAYVLLTGALVFTDSSPINVALKHVKKRPVPPSQRTGQAIPVDLERVVMACLEKDPGARPATAREIDRLLAACEVPPWNDEDAAAWWKRHLPPASPLRASSQTPPHTPSAVQKASR